jgi:hypothetical protein
LLVRTLSLFEFINASLIRRAQIKPTILEELRRLDMFGLNVANSSGTRRVCLTVPLFPKQAAHAAKSGRQSICTKLYNFA